MSKVVNAVFKKSAYYSDNKPFVIAANTNGDGLTLLVEGRALLAWSWDEAFYVNFNDLVDEAMRKLDKLHEHIAGIHASLLSQAQADYDRAIRDAKEDYADRVQQITADFRKSLREAGFTIEKIDLDQN